MRPGETYTELQPKDGDIVLFCEHICVTPTRIEFYGKTLHWYVGDGEVTHEDLATGKKTKLCAPFTCICEDCMLRFSDPHDAVTQHGAWIGDDPIVVKDVLCQ